MLGMRLNDLEMEREYENFNQDCTGECPMVWQVPVFSVILRYLQPVWSTLYANTYQRVFNSLNSKSNAGNHRVGCYF